jgi:hypothetical protein
MGDKEGIHRLPYSIASSYTLNLFHKKIIFNLRSINISV